MPWPKGKPRRGYIRKDGKPHEKVSSVALPRDDVAVDTVKVVPRTRKVESDLPKVSEDTKDEVEIHGMVGTGAITEVCPNCGYAYADGGYCNDCGWSAPVRVDEWGTHQGRRF